MHRRRVAFVDRLACVLVTLIFLFSENVKAATAPVIGFSSIEGQSGRTREATLVLGWLTDAEVAGIQFDIVAKGDKNKVVVGDLRLSNIESVVSRQDIIQDSLGDRVGERVVVAKRMGTFSSSDNEAIGNLGLRFQGLEAIEFELSLRNVVVSSVEGTSQRAFGGSGAVALAAAEIPVFTEIEEPVKSEITIRNFIVTDSLVVIELEGRDEATVAVEASENLNEWQNVTRLSFANGFATVVDPVSETRRRFYRFRVVE